MHWLGEILALFSILMNVGSLTLSLHCYIQGFLICAATICTAVGFTCSRRRISSLLLLSPVGRLAVWAVLLTQEFSVCAVHLCRLLLDAGDGARYSSRRYGRLRQRQESYSLVLIVTRFPEKAAAGSLPTFITTAWRGVANMAAGCYIVTCTQSTKLSTTSLLANLYLTQMVC